MTWFSGGLNSGLMVGIDALLGLFHPESLYDVLHICLLLLKHFLLKITSQQLDFHRLAEEHILKEHIPVKCSEVFQLANTLILQKLKYGHTTISLKNRLFSFFTEIPLLFITILIIMVLFSTVTIIYFPDFI